MWLLNVMAVEKKRSEIIINILGWATGCKMMLIIKIETLNIIG